MNDGPSTALLILLVIVGVLIVASLALVITRRRPREAPPEAEAPTEAPPEAPPTPPPTAEAPPAPPVAPPTPPPVAPPEVEAPEALPEVEAPPQEAPPVVEAPPTAEAPPAPQVEAPPVEAPPEPETPPVEVPKRRRVRGIGGAIAGLFKRGSLTAEDWEELEEILLRADVGVAATTRIVEDLRNRKKIDDGMAALKEELLAVLGDADRSMRHEGSPTIWLITGVNGSGKTTTIGKLAAQLGREGKSVVLAAADTFRAAADDQLEIWADRSGAQIVKHQHGADPAAVVFDGVKAAKARNADVLIVDTAGRLQTKRNLMEELAKIKRVLEREAGPPAESILVLDATTGQNGLQQARAFSEAVQITGVALTKLDGTAKGGIVIAVQQDLGIPVKLVGLGEGIDDLAPFEPQQFVDDLLED